MSIAHRQTLNARILELLDRGMTSSLHLHGHKSCKEISASDQFILKSISFGKEYLVNSKTHKGMVVLIACADPLLTMYALYGSIWSGSIPLILPAQSIFSPIKKNDEIIKRYTHQFNQCRVITDLDIKNQAALKINSEIISTLPCSDPSCTHNIQPDDIAFLQATSASTGKSKLVPVTHEKIIYQVQQQTKVLAPNNKGVFCSWLPLNHDMGLIPTAFLTLLNDFNNHFMTPVSFLRNPKRWFEIISTYSCTITTAPLFGYRYALENIPIEHVLECDLSSMKTACVGAEPIQKEVLDRFSIKFSRIGFKKKAFLPCYGLAEGTLAVTFGKVEEEYSFTAVDRTTINFGKEISLSRDSDPSSILFANLGQPVLETEIMLKLDNEIFTNSPLVLGEVCIKGPSVCLKYYHTSNKIVPTQLNQNKYVPTGDLGFIHQDNLYIVDRCKNIIISNGVNYFPYELEEKLARHFKISSRSVIVFQLTSDLSNRIIALIEMKPEQIDQARKRIDQVYSLGLTLIDTITIASKGFIDLTTSGKKKYYLAKMKYMQGEYTCLLNKQPTLEA